MTYFICLHVNPPYLPFHGKFYGENKLFNYWQHFAVFNGQQISVLHKPHSQKTKKPSGNKLGNAKEVFNFKFAICVCFLLAILSHYVYMFKIKNRLRFPLAGAPA